MRIEAATMDDFREIGSLLERSYASQMLTTYGRDALARTLPFITKPNANLLASGRFYKASIDGEIAGCGGWSSQSPAGTLAAGLGHVRHFAVAPHQARRGIGRAIFERCVEDAREAQIFEFECLASLNAVGFYHRLGFREHGKTLIELAPEIQLPCIIMKASEAELTQSQR